MGKTGAEGDRMEEAKAINKSLSALGDVIGALTSGQKHVPYRNHKLTMLLSDSLGGNAKTLMFVNVSPVDYNFNETCNSLAFASRVKKVVNNSSKSVRVFFLSFLFFVFFWHVLLSLLLAMSRTGLVLNVGFVLIHLFFFFDSFIRWKRKRSNN